jgi:hypothetical protein
MAYSLAIPYEQRTITSIYTYLELTISFQACIKLCYEQATSCNNIVQSSAKPSVTPKIIVLMQHILCSMAETSQF